MAKKDGTKGKSAKQEAKRGGKFTLTVPIDASGIDLSPGDDNAQEVRVVARDRSGALSGTSVKLSSGKSAKAKLSFGSDPGPLHIAVGPAEATDEEVMALQTLTVDVSRRKWAGEPSIELQPVVVTSYWWWWWRRWCRTFTVRGRVTCPDGSPVPGAEVCAFDVDWWFIWSSQQQVGCATTNVDGTFEITFRWCCGWWPWWWWRARRWQLDDLLASRVNEVLRPRPDLTLGRIEHQPSLAAFEHVLGDETLRTARTIRSDDVNALPGLREELLTRLASRSTARSASGLAVVSLASVDGLLAGPALQSHPGLRRAGSGDSPGGARPDTLERGHGHDREPGRIGERVLRAAMRPTPVR